MGGDIYVVDVCGGVPRCMTLDNSWHGDGVLWQMGDRTRAPRQLTDGSLALAFPAASPRGNRIAFTAYHNITSIWQVNEKGQTQLTFEDAGDSNPQVLPDGRPLLSAATGRAPSRSGLVTAMAVTAIALPISTALL